MLFVRSTFRNPICLQMLSLNNHICNFYRYELFGGFIIVNHFRLEKVIILDTTISYLKIRYLNMFY